MRVLQVRKVTLLQPVPVFDVSVPGPENFLLAAGVFVHNSKDVADAVCGAYTTLLERRSSWHDAAVDDEASAESLRHEYTDRMDEPRPY